MLARVNPAEAEELLAQAEQDVRDRWHLLERMAELTPAGS